MASDSKIFALGLAVLGLTGVGAIRAEQADIATSAPGAIGETRPARSSCPTFAWGQTSDVDGYELSIVRAGAEIFRTYVPGGASSFTLSSEACLEVGDYEWSLRPWRVDAAGKEVPGSWSPPRSFSVSLDVAVEEALKTLRRSLLSGDENVGSSDRGDLLARMRRVMKGTEPLTFLSSGASLRGELSDVSGEKSGVLGVVHSSSGAGVVAANLALGPELVLSGNTGNASDTGHIRSEAAGDLRLEAVKGIKLTGDGLVVKNGASTILSVNGSGTLTAHSFTGDGSTLTGVGSPVDLACSGCVQGSEVVNGTITGSDVSSVSGADLSGSAVNPTTVADGSVSGYHIQNASIGFDQIAANAVDSAEISSAAVGYLEIATGGVGASEIATGGVRAPDWGRVYRVKVECNGECTDGFADDICGLTVGSGSRAVGVDCSAGDVTINGVIGCGGNNICWPDTIDTPTLDVCADVLGAKDAIVTCLDN